MQILFEVVESSKLSTEVNRMQPLPPRRSPLAYPIGYQPYKTEDGQRFVPSKFPNLQLCMLFFNDCSAFTLSRIYMSCMDCNSNLFPPIAFESEVYLFEAKAFFKCFLKFKVLKFRSEV